MPNVVFVAPYFLPTTNRFIAAAAAVPGTRLGLISQDLEERLPPGIRRRLAAHWRTDDALEPDSLVEAVGAIGRQLGSVDRLMGPLEELQVPMAQVREVLSIPGMRRETAHNFRDKSRMKDVLRRHGLPCARHRLVGGVEEAWAFVVEVGYPIVVKPPAGSGARDTHRVESAKQLTELLGFIRLNPVRPTLFEEFISGEEHSFDCVFVDGHPVWHSISRYYPAPLEVLESSWIQWCVLLPQNIDGPEFAEIRQVGPAALAALGLQTGLAHMEWFRRPDGSVAVSEAGARPPGAQFSTLISYAHDFDLYSAWARLVILEEFEPPVRKYAVGAAYLRGQGLGRVVGVSGLDRAQDVVAGMVVETNLPKPDQVKSDHYEGEGYVILRHVDTEMVKRGLAAIVSNVRVELA